MLYGRSPLLHRHNQSARLVVSSSLLMMVLKAMQRWWLWLVLALAAGGTVLGWSRWRSAAASPEEVMRRQEQILERAPAGARRAFSLGVDACEARDYEPAVEALRQAAIEAPECALIHHNLGVAYVGMGQPAGALEAFRRALALEPSLADSWLQVGMIEIEEKDYAAAEDCLNRALRLNPGLEQVRLALSHLWLLRGDLGQAEGLAREALRRGPDSYRAWMCLGDVLARSSAPDASREALACFRKATVLADGETDPDGFSYRRLAEMSLRLNDTEEAIQALHKAIQRDAANPASWYLLARAQRQAGRTTEAEQSSHRARQVLRWAAEVKTLRERIRETPGDAALYFRLGAVEASRGKTAAAVAAYRAGLARDPASHSARQALAALEQRSTRLPAVGKTGTVEP